MTARAPAGLVEHAVGRFCCASVVQGLVLSGQQGDERMSLHLLQHQPSIDAWQLLPRGRGRRRDAVGHAEGTWAGQGRMLTLPQEPEAGTHPEDVLESATAHVPRSGHTNIQKFR